MKKMLAILTVIFLSGCIGQSRPARFYNITPQTQAMRTFKSARIFVGIEPVKVPVYLDKPQIVTRNSNEVELNISELNRWAEPLSDSIQNTLAADIGSIMPDATVKPSSFRREGFDYIVWVEITKFEGVWNENAVLDAWWSILDSDNKSVARDQVSLSRPLGQTYDNLVQQQSILLGELSEKIAARLAKLPK